MDLLLIRHGEIPSNIKKVYAGKSSEKLTEKGLFQAKEVSEEIKNYDVHSLYSSPVFRAVQTAGIIGNTLGINYFTENDFREMELGPWEGLSEDKVAQLYPEEWQTWQNRPADLKLSGRETLHSLLMRVLRGLQKIHQAERDKTIVMVTHVAIIRVLLLWRAKKSLNLYKTIDVPNGKVFEVNL